MIKAIKQQPIITLFPEVKNTNHTQSFKKTLSPLASAIKTSLFGLSLAHGNAQAVNIEVTSNSDVSANDTHCTLREAITTSLPLMNGCIATGFGDDRTITFSPSMSSNTIGLRGSYILIDSGSEFTIDASNITGGITIDAQNDSRVFTLPNAILSIDNLTIKNGSTESQSYLDRSGGGILAFGSTITLYNSTISGNTATSRGGGISISGSTLNITNSILTDNFASDIGGGLSAFFSSVYMNNSIVSGNYSDGTGGALYANETTVDLNGSTLSGNSASYRGGAIYAAKATIKLSKSTVTENSTAVDGGGIFARDTRTTITLSDSLVSDNLAGDDGGGVFASFSTINLTNSTLSNNKAGSTGDGGGLYAVYSASIALSNSTVSGNSAGDDGGGIFARLSSKLTFRNSTLSDNSADDDGGGLALFTSASANLSNSIIANSSIGVNCFFHSSSGADVSSDTNSIVEGGSCNTSRTIDPGLEPLANNGGLGLTHALRADSPARDSGELSNCTVRDQRGLLRNNGDGKCDVGAIEYSLNDSSSFYVIPLSNGKTVVIPL